MKIAPGRHPGKDYRVPSGTKVVATAGGNVVRANFSVTYGDIVIINHGNSADGIGNVCSLYAHGSELIIKKGDLVSEGQLIMLSGSSGSMTTRP